MVYQGKILIMEEVYILERSFQQQYVGWVEAGLGKRQS